MLPKAILALSAIAFLGIGVTFIAAPNALLPRVNISAPEGTALTDIRAIYGGLDLGVDIALAYCLVRGHTALGLRVTAFVLGGIALGRAIGIVLDDNQTTITYVLWATEIGGALIAAFGLALQRKDSEP
jgi:hypothetical protein